jgi:ABC-2 type transport system permease protein
MKALRTLLAFLRLGLLNELAYRANFWVQLLESTFTVGSVLALIAIVTSQTERLGGWSQDELLAIVGVYFLVFGVVNATIAPSLSRFIEDVRLGRLDFTLLKPADAQFLVSIAEFQPWKSVDFALGLLVLGHSLWSLGHALSVLQLLQFVVTLGAGLALVYSFWIALATLAFWFVRIENILAIFWMVYNAGRWPVSIYPGWLRFALTVVVPVAFAVTVPAEAVTGRLELQTLLVTVSLAIASLIASRLFWRFGLKSYSGASA